MALGLTACGGERERGEKLSFQAAPAYTIEETALPIASGKLHGSCVSGEAMYFLATGEGEASPGLCRVPLNGQRVESPVYFFVSGDPIVLFAYQLAPGQGQLERFMDPYRSVERVDASDWELFGLISEQAKPYFDGETSLDEAVRQIQSRVGLYVREQR